MWTVEVASACPRPFAAAALSCRCRPCRCPCRTPARGLPPSPGVRRATWTVEPAFVCQRVAAAGVQELRLAPVAPARCPSPSPPRCLCAPPATWTAAAAAAWRKPPASSAATTPPPPWRRRRPPRRWRPPRWAPRERPPPQPLVPPPQHWSPPAPGSSRGPPPCRSAQQAMWTAAPASAYLKRRVSYAREHGRTPPTRDRSSPSPPRCHTAQRAMWIVAPAFASRSPRVSTAPAPGPAPAAPVPAPVVPTRRSPPRRSCRDPPRCHTARPAMLTAARAFVFHMLPASGAQELIPPRQCIPVPPCRLLRDQCLDTSTADHPW
mmetsp:Transcript_87750/g.139343  ORF Transcript_87750/g.139343 Transcript_87750/m.139343 type:complete len:321 (-) Transcript_87750:702-1664(-)